MSVRTVLISGPPAVGKSKAAALIASEVLPGARYYLRLRLHAGDGPLATVPCAEAGDRPPGEGWSGAFTVFYAPERLFEILPETLRLVRNLNRDAWVLIESLSDPAVRSAYGYDLSLFVMRVPESLEDVFRPRAEAAALVREAMLDTGAFAAEMFGLPPLPTVDADLERKAAGGPAGVELLLKSVQRVMPDEEYEAFLATPLGAEVEARAQLRPAYQAMLEAEVILVNNELGEETLLLRAFVQRLSGLLSRRLQAIHGRGVLYWGNLDDAADPVRVRLCRRLRGLLGIREPAPQEFPPSP